MLYSVIFIVHAFFFFFLLMLLIDDEKAILFCGERIIQIRVEVFLKKKRDKVNNSKVITKYEKRFHVVFTQDGRLLCILLFMAEECDFLSVVSPILLLLTVEGPPCSIFLYSNFWKN